MGSTVFPLTDALGAEIATILRDLPPPVVLLTRGHGTVDEFVWRASRILGIRCFKFVSAGGADNWKRDVELADAADEVIAFFASSTLSNMNTGTGHLVERALDKKKKVRAFTEVNDQIVFAGEWP